MPIFSVRKCKMRGIALVTTLAFLVLLTVLILAFFTSVQTEVNNANTYSRSVSVKQLVDSATQVVIGQITDGTKSLKAAGGTDRITWASQPGMIRSWDSTGTGFKAFKLYSSADMVVDLASGPYKASDPATLDTEIPTNWPSQAARFTDLNAPVMILDAAGSITRGGKKYRASYPIIDPASLLGTDAVEGFSLTSTPRGSSSGTFTTATDPSQVSGGLTSNPVPMPVAWVYVLKDGTLSVPSGASGTKVTWGAGGSSPSKDNPIVGRVAFWTDDESCKINVNTASEPTPWDTPRMVGKQDLDYGKFQPAAKEYQRFPGHPFMTALSPVFFPNTPSKNLTAAQKEELYKIVPRIGTGGSLAATKAVTDVPSPVISTDQERLFANVDEFLFQPPKPVDTVRPENSAVSAAITPAKLKRSRFFLTANSRAPEINLFGQPRVSLWPEWEDPAAPAVSKRTAYDKLSAFCSTLGSANYPYYFQRKNPNSPTVDWTNITRNQDIYKYLQALTSQPIPGFAGNFSAKWGADRDQLLTEVFDYIRCTNLKDPQTGATSYTKNDSVRQPLELNGQVAPIYLASNDTKGFGRFHTISQFGMHFICSQDGPDGLSTFPALGYPSDGQAALAPGQRAIEAAFYLEPFSPSLGWYALKDFMSFNVTFLTPMTVNGKALNMKSGFGKLDNGVGYAYHSAGRERGGAGGIRGPIRVIGSGTYPWTSANGSSRPFVDATSGTMTFSGGQIKVEVYSGLAQTAANLVQTFNMNFPGGDIPVPKLVRTDAAAYEGTGPWPSPLWWRFSNRFEFVGNPPQAPGAEYTDSKRRWGAKGGPPGFKAGSVFRQEDTVRTIVPDSGDIRLIAAKSIVAATDFVKVRSDNWDGAGAPGFLHIFSEAGGTQFLFGHSNEPGPKPAAEISTAALDDQLHGSSAVEYHYSRLPEIRPGAGKLFNKWNDVDNGIAQWPDGAYINKPDEGNTRTVNGYPYFSSSEYVENGFVEVFFSPSRMVPSAGMLGSLPTGVKRNRPWETLLFRPELKAVSGERHPGLGAPLTGPPYTSPPDHLLMDLFWNPSVEPYAISEPFSTAGKINLNYEITPFTYIRRATALHALMKSEEPLAIPNSVTKIDKLWDHETNANLFPDDSLVQDSALGADWKKLRDGGIVGGVDCSKLRRPINMAETLKQFDTKFTAGEIFRSATQICDMHLVRDGETLANYTGDNIWPNYLTTGDNTRERPYANLYGRLTTKSNTYTVHVRAQVLRQPTSSPATEWDESKGQIGAEFRGSTIVERYVDPTDPKLVDYALPANKDLVVDDSYKTRIVATKKFTP